MEKEIDLEKLIREVQERPGLWDRSNPSYGDKIKRKEVWEEIVNVFAGESTQQEKRVIGHSLQKKWKNLRDRYSRNLLEREGKSCDGSTRKPPYVYAQQMRFLKDIVLNRNASCSMDDSTTNEEISSSVNRSQLTGTSHKRSEDKHTGHLTKKKKFNPAEEKLTRLKMLQDNALRREQKEKLEEDDDRHFLLSLLPVLKSIPPHLKVAARIDIMQSINKYTLFNPSFHSIHLQCQSCYEAPPHHLRQHRTGQYQLAQTHQPFQTVQACSQSNLDPNLSPTESPPAFYATNIVTEEDSDVSVF